MTDLPVPRQPRSWLPDWSDLWTGFPSWAGLRPLIDTHLIRLEDEVQGGHYLLRAELPGIDPAKDVDITVHDGQLPSRPNAARRRKPRAARSSPTAHLPARSPCRPAPTKRTSKPPTTRAS